MQTKYQFKNFALPVNQSLVLRTNGYLVYRVAHDGRESSRHFPHGLGQVVMEAEWIVRQMLETQQPCEVYERFRATEYDVEVDHGEAFTTCRVSRSATAFDLEALFGYGQRTAYLVSPENISGLLSAYRDAAFEYHHGTREMTAPVLRPRSDHYRKSQHLDLCGMSNLMHALVRAGMLEVVP